MFFQSEGEGGTEIQTGTLNKTIVRTVLVSNLFVDMLIGTRKYVDGRITLVRTHSGDQGPSLLSAYYV